MTDAELILAIVQSEQRWFGVLTGLRAMHAQSLGKNMTAVQWLPDGGRGNFGWLGYYWESPPFWFGYGLRGNAWLPLIECDIRRCGSDYMRQLETSLPSTWSDTDRFAGQFWRLWCPAVSQGNAAVQSAWFMERSRELHEFTVSA